MRKPKWKIKGEKRARKNLSEIWDKAKKVSDFLPLIRFSRASRPVNQRAWIKYGVLGFIGYFKHGWRIVNFIAPICVPEEEGPAKLDLMEPSATSAIERLLGTFLRKHPVLKFREGS